MSSGKAFPPQLYLKDKLENKIYYISEIEHLAIIEAKDKELARLRTALEKCARANERIMKNGKWGPDFVLSRIDIKTFAEQALAGGKDAV